MVSTAFAIGSDMSGGSISIDTHITTSGSGNTANLGTSNGYITNTISKLSDSPKLEKVRLKQLLFHLQIAIELRLIHLLMIKSWL